MLGKGFRFHFAFLVVVLVFLSTSTAGEVVNGQVVETSTATFRGKWVDVSPYQLPDYHARVAAYTRIPYAEPPVGDLRFRRPVPKVIEGDFDATREGIACAQMKQPAFDVAMETSEDCLYLDIFVPDPKV